MRRSAGKALAIALVIVAVTVVAVREVSGGADGYTVHAQFVDAGQLVVGNVVQVAGRRIGRVSELRLTDDGRADVALEISDERYRPLHRGTRMTIRTIGLAGIANRYVDVSPGSRRAPEISDGEALDTNETTGIVDLDMLFNAFGPQTRKDLQRLLRAGADGFAGHERSVNRLLRYLAPASAQLHALLDDVTRDEAAVEQLLQAGASVASALAARDDDITEGVDASGHALAAVAAQRSSLQRALRRAPPVLTQARGTLRELTRTLRVARPALRDARPVAPRLATTVRRVPGVAKRAEPPLRQIEVLLDPTRRALRALPALRDSGVPALRGLTSALTSSAPILAGLRPYTLDILHGLVIGPGNTTGHYDANGNYARVMGLGSVPSGLAGLPSLLPDINPPVFSGESFGHTARCPGDAEPGRASDGSLPYVPDESLCERKDGP